MITTTLNTGQLELTPIAKAGRKTHVFGQTELVRTLRQLAAVGVRWATAGELLARMGQPITETGKRQLRAACEALGSTVVTGQAGYCLAEHATCDELQRAANWFFSQARKMEKRAIAYQRYRHRGRGEQEAA